MAAKTCPTAAKSNVQAIWAALEDVSGELQKPAPEDYVVPRGNASMTQTPGTTPSEELSESLNTIDLFQNAVEPGEAELPMYIRLPKDGSHMQGHALMLALMGNVQEPESVTAKVSSAPMTVPAGIDENALTIPYERTGTNQFPSSGVVTIGAEKISFTDSAGDKLSGCIRGENGTTALPHDDQTEILLEVKASLNDTAGIDDQADTIPFDGATGDFPASGTIKIGAEEIEYTGLGLNSFTGCTRGANGTIADNHDDDAEITFNVTAKINKPEGQADGELDDEMTTIAISDVDEESGFFPPRGVVVIDDEEILYTGVELDENDKVIALTGCTRGYGKTDAAPHTGDAVITLKSRVYSQDICRNTVSIWMKMDNLVTFGSGGVVTQCEFGLAREGGQSADMTVQFRRMGWAGRSYIQEAPTDKGVLKVQNGKGQDASYAYTEGAYILNHTKKDDNGGAGYRIKAVDYEKGTITVDGDVTSWEVDDRIDPWTPESHPIGDALESRDARIFIDGKTGRIREGSVTVGTPAEFLAEIGEEFPGESVDTKREITIGMNGYLRAEDARELGRGYESYEAGVAVRLGKKSGQFLALQMPRVKMVMPEIGTEGAAFTMDRNGTVLGVKGEDALYIIQE